METKLCFKLRAQASKVLWSALVLLVFAFACNKAGKNQSYPSDPSQTQPAEPKKRWRPRLVVTIVLDQMGSDTFARYRPEFSEEGAFAKFLQHGVYFQKSRFSHATTITAPGHTTVHTGTTPGHHGVASNFRFSSSRGSIVSYFDDGKHAVHGVSNLYASPAPLTAETVADALKRQTGGKAKAVGISIKSRAAIPCVGKAADAAYWYEPKIPGFTTSTFYAKEEPKWLADWRKQHPWEKGNMLWEALDSERYEKLLGKDKHDGEGESYGLGNAFPHDLSKLESPEGAWMATPMSTVSLLELARAVVEEWDLGEDDTPDLLSISVSATDVIGHIFGPHSWEYLDNLLRTDRELRSFFDWLEKRTDFAVLLTSDHGAAALPEIYREQKQGRAKTSGKKPVESVRIEIPRWIAKIEKTLSKQLNSKKRGAKPIVKPPYILHYSPPHIELHDNAEKSPRRDDIVAQIIKIIEEDPAFHSAYALKDLKPLRSAANPIPRDIANSTPPGFWGDIYVVPEKYTVVMGGAHGTTHGTPWAYDRQVPVLLYHPSIKTGTYSQVVQQESVATTVAYFLGIDAPDHAKAPLLPISMGSSH